MGQEPEPEAHRLRGFLMRVRFLTWRDWFPKRRYLLMLTLFLAIVLIIGFIGIYNFGPFQRKTMAPYSLAISTALSGPQEEAGQEALVAQHVREQPTARAGLVVAIGSGHRELAIGRTDSHGYLAC